MAGDELVPLMLAKFARVCELLCVCPQRAGPYDLLARPLLLLLLSFLVGCFIPEAGPSLKTHAQAHTHTPVVDG